MQPDPLAKNLLEKFGWIWKNLRRNLGKSDITFEQIWLDLGKIKILHPQKYSTSHGYAEVPIPW